MQQLPDVISIIGNLYWKICTSIISKINNILYMNKKKTNHKYLKDFKLLIKHKNKKFPGSFQVKSWDRLCK